MEIKKIMEFDKAKNEMIEAMNKFYMVLEKNDISFIDNYPKYLPSFDEFVCDLMDIQYSSEN